MNPLWRESQPDQITCQEQEKQAEKQKIIGKGRGTCTQFSPKLGKEAKLSISNLYTFRSDWRSDLDPESFTDKSYAGAGTRKTATCSKSLKPDQCRIVSQWNIFWMGGFRGLPGIAVTWQGLWLSLAQRVRGSEGILYPL